MTIGGHVTAIGETIGTTWQEWAARAKAILIETPAEASEEVLADAARRALKCIEIARRIKTISAK